MRIHGIALLPSLVLMATSIAAQVPATFAVFGEGCAGSGTGLGARHVVPTRMANQYGAGNAIPFGWSPHRYQQVVAGSELPVALTLAGLSLRQPHLGPISHRFILDAEIQVGATTKTPATMSTTFVDNFDDGAPVVVWPRAQIEFPDMVPSGPSSPADFLVTIEWAQTFDWIPAAGRNFLMQVTVFGNSYGGTASGYAFDATGGGDIGRLYSSSVTAPSGTREPGLGIVLGLRELTHTAVPRLYSTNTPQIGDTFRVRVSQARASAFATMALGFSATAWSGYPLPLELGLIGAPGCSFLTSVEVALPFPIGTAGTGSRTYTVPNDINLLRLTFYNQAVVMDPMANALGVAFSNAGVAVVGNQ